MQLPVSARIPAPGEDCPANTGIELLTSAFAMTMLSPGQADVLPVELTYEDGSKDVVFLTSTEGGTALAGLMFGPREATSEAFYEWGQGILPVIKDMLDAYDEDPDAPVQSDKVIETTAVEEAPGD